MDNTTMQNLIRKIIYTCNNVSKLNEHLPDKLALTSKSCSGGYTEHSVYVDNTCVVVFRFQKTNVIASMTYPVLLNDTTLQLIYDHLEKGLAKFTTQREIEKAEAERRKIKRMEAMEEFVFEALGEVK